MKLYLDDIRSPPDETWTLVKTVEEAKALLLPGDVECASLDHDLGMVETSPGIFSETEQPNGMALCRWMAETGHWPKFKPAVHSANVVAAPVMRAFIERFWRAK